MQLKIDEFKKIILLHIIGSLTECHLKETELIWNYIISKKPSSIGVNCKDLNMIDVAAIGTLVLFLNNAMNKRIELIFYDISSEIQSLFSVTHLDDFFTIKTGNFIDKKYLSFTEVA